MADLLAALKNAGLVTDKDVKNVERERREAEKRREQELLAQAANRKPRSRSEAETDGQAPTEQSVLPD
jgi:hypothetical protein